MEAKFGGTVEYDGVKIVKHENAGEVSNVVIGRTGEIRIIDNDLLKPQLPITYLMELPL
ncbi:MAG: hypothetical protein R2728_15310 [Chitinophagales bacterium]